LKTKGCNSLFSLIFYLSSFNFHLVTFIFNPAMRQQSKESIVILFIVGVLALNYPMLDLFDQPWMPFGVPLLYLYLYLVWLVLIILLIVVVEHSEIHRPDRPATLLGNPSQPEAAPTERRRASDANPTESP